MIMHVGQVMYLLGQEKNSRSYSLRTCIHPWRIVFHTTSASETWTDLELRTPVV